MKERRKDIKMKIIIGADHRGANLATKIYENLKEQGYDIIKSNVPTSEEDDYPDFAFDVCKQVLENKENLGIVICGNGIGISIAANKVQGIRCARVTSKEDAHHAKNHNGANVIAFGGLTLEDALEMIKTFIETPFPTEERHLRRIQKIIDYEQGVYNGL